MRSELKKAWRYVVVGILVGLITSVVVSLMSPPKVLAAEQILLPGYWANKEKTICACPTPPPAYPQCYCLVSG